MSEDKLKETKNAWYAYQLKYQFCWMCGEPLVMKHHEIDSEGYVLYCRDGTWNKNKR